MRSRLWKWFPILLLTVCAAFAVTAAESLDDQYFRIYGVVNEADALYSGGQTNAALAKYRQAFTELWNLKKANPNWNTSVVTFRLNALTEKIKGITDPPISSSAPVAGTGGTSKAGAKVGAGDRVKVLNAGTEPRQVLRFHVASNSTQTVQLSVKIGMSIQPGATPIQEIKLPAMLMTLEAAVQEVSAEGDVSFRTVIKDVSVTEEAGVMPEVAKAMKDSVATIKGLSSSGIISSRGISRNVEVNAPATIDPQAQQSIEQMKEVTENLTTPLPEEAVGAGAKWEVKQQTKSQGMTINQTATYQLVAVEGDRLTVTSTIVQSAANQKIQSPVMQGMKVDLTRMTGGGTGTTEVNLAQLMPAKAMAALRTDMAMAMAVGTQRQAMTMKMNFEVQLESK